MTPLSLPGPAASITFRMMDVVGATRSPFTGRRQVQAHDGQWWEADITIPPLVGRDAYEPWLSFFARLQGRLGTFYLTNPKTAQPRGSAKDAPGAPVVAGAGQTGAELAVQGLPSDAVGYLKEGDMIQLGTGLETRLHRVLDDVDTDGAGSGLLNLWPRIRTGEAPAAGAAVLVSYAAGLFALEDNRREWTVDPGDLVGGIVLVAKEAL